MPEQYDILIAGSGFGGSLTALILHNMGYRVCLLEKGKHPRFAIGESSTPIADMLLRNLSSKYDLPWLYDFSRYGSWQRAHPEIVCGLKRGFTYYKHYPGKAFSTDANHHDELFIAASSDDLQSDTHWYRADFDAFLVDKVKESGIAYFDLTDIIATVLEKDQWKVNCLRGEKSIAIQAALFIDATGGGVLVDKIFSVRSSAESFLTHSFAVFSHFDDLPEWLELLQQRGISSNDYPYHPDRSALHHLLDEGWVWALRFNNNRTSWGFSLNGWHEHLHRMSTDEIWQTMMTKYPDMNRILKDAAFSPQPGKILRSGRLQRKLERAYGDGWVALPHTVGFVDPFFSTGIAHSLTGIERIANLLSQGLDEPKQLAQGLNAYEQAVFEELQLIDLLVAGCYQTMHCFPLFNAWSMLYFGFLIRHEQKRLRNLSVGHYLEANDPEVQAMAQTSYQELQQLVKQPAISASDINRFTDRIRERIRPFNTAGLLNPSFRNMYRHTAAVL